MLSNGMYVLTARNGGRYGVATVTWLSQASFKPPLIMAAVRTESNVFRCLSESKAAVVHVLAHDQQGLARKFFSPTRMEPGALNGEPFREGRTSAPILERAPAYLECLIRRIVETGGDHAVVIMEVVESARLREFVPLTIADSPWEYGG